MQDTHDAHSRGAALQAYVSGGKVVIVDLDLTGLVSHYWLLILRRDAKKVDQWMTSCVMSLRE
jgi:hypothetical protein